MKKRKLIRGSLITKDRLERWSSRAAFLAHLTEVTGRTVSESNLRRAEDGHATGITLKLVSRALGYHESRYEYGNESISDSLHSRMVNLSGEWLTYYLESDNTAAPYLATERLFIEQSGSEIKGIYEPVATDHPDGYVGSTAFSLKGLLIDNVVYGSYSVDGREKSTGTGVFQLTVMKLGLWAEGVCTFCSDTGEIGVSANIWVKRDNENFSLMKKQARNILSEKKPFFVLPISTEQNNER